MFKIYETSGGAVVELDKSTTLMGIAIRLEVIVVDDRTVAAWLLEDGPLLRLVLPGEA